MRWLGWVITWGGIFLAFIALAALASYGQLHGWNAVANLTLAEDRIAINVIFGWSEPYLAPIQASRLGRFPVWWREGVIMLAIIVSQWSQVIADGKAKLRDALEYLAVSVVAGLGSYLLGASGTFSEAAFFGVAGVFAQLLARGLVSFLVGRATEPEAWTGRYLLRSTTLLTLGAAGVLLVNAGLRLNGL
jgi:hypothetical protein